MNDQEAMEMMARCVSEIRELRRRIDQLQPKADAYDNIAAILHLLPRQGVGMAEDLVWRLEKRMLELQKEREDREAAEAKGPPHGGPSTGGQGKHGV